jgi:soluble lytic murein transglycosylase-like protein
MPAAHIAAFEPIGQPVVPAQTVAAEVKAPEPVVEAGLKTPQQLIEEAAARHNIPASFLKLVANAESGMNPNAVSPKGAIGVMQLMPDTARALGANPHDTAQNVDAGTRYLRDLLIQYQGNDDQLRRALAAYNAGPGAVERFNGVPPYRETQNYVHKIVEQYKRTGGQ